MSKTKTQPPVAAAKPKRKASASPVVVAGDPFAAPATADLSYISPGLRPLAVRADSLLRDHKNLKKHQDADLSAQQASMEAWLIYRPLVVQRSTRRIVIGNGTHEAAMRCGYEYVPAEIRELTDKQADALAFSDNAVATLAPWDEVLMKEMGAELAGLMKDINLDGLVNSVLLDLELPELPVVDPDEKSDESAQAEEPETAQQAQAQYLHRLQVVCAGEPELLKLAGELEERGLTVKIMPTKVL